MKSKRAKAALESNDFFTATMRGPKHVLAIATRAIELAEEDARQRAVKAYCKSVYGVFCDDCDNCDFDTDTCERRNEYLKYYDNEE